MKRFKIDNWSSVVLTKNPKSDNVPNDCRVYLVTIIKKGGKKREIVYVGSSNNLHTRIRGHNVISLLRWHLKDYTIELWHKDFGNRVSNSYNERKLILEFKPVFNKEWRAMETYLVDTAAFWKQVGLEPVTSHKKPFHARNNSFLNN